MKTFFAFVILFSLSNGAIAQSGPIPGGLPGAGGLPGVGLPGVGLPGSPTIDPTTGQPIPSVPRLSGITKPKAMTACRLEFQVADQIFFVNSIGGNFLLNVSHTSPKGEHAFTIQGEFLPGAGAEVGMLDFEAKLMESNLDDGVNGEYNSKGSTTVKKDQSQQLATLGHHILSLTVKDVQEKK